ncbi:MAG: SGNH/GDSL hydrolase family protein [Bdellovibrionota bacterium]
MDLDSKRTKLFLILGGTIFGILFGVLTAKVVVHFRRGALPAGAEFESVDDLRRAMLQRDDNDVLPDQSVSLRTIISPDPSDLIIYRLKPNLDVTFRGVNVKTNSYGMRSPEITVEKPANTFRLALLGDSFAFGWGVEADKIFAKVIQDELAKKFAGRNVEVLNFGVPGYASFQEAALFEDSGFKFSPDAVLVYFVENDFGLPFYIKNFGRESGDLVNNQHFEKLRARVADTEADQGNIELLKNLDANRALSKLAQVCAERNIPVFLVINPKPNWKQQYGRLRRARREKNLQTLFIRDEIEKMIDDRHLTGADVRLPDDPHPNALKHGMLGTVIAEKLFAALQEQAPH